MSTPELGDGLQALGLPAEPAICDRLLRYRDELARWNRVHNLSGVRDPERMVAVHLLDSLALLPLVRGKRLADIGSGAGLPGLPLALADPELEVVLVEPRAKRALFLDHVVRTLAIDNVKVERSRAQDLSAHPGHETVTARAFGTLAELIVAAAHLLQPRGHMLVAKGRDPGAEIAALPAGWTAEVLPLRVPGIEASRHAVRVYRARAED